MTRCYWCEQPLDIIFNEGVVEDASGDSFYCDFCEQYQHNSEECGCFCDFSDGEIYSRITGMMPPSEVIEIGLEAIKVELTGIWKTDMDGFQDKYMPYLIKDEDKIDKLASTLYEYAKELMSKLGDSAECTNCEIDIIENNK